jgi:hypothetical protein
MVKLVAYNAKADLQVLTDPPKAFRPESVKLAGMARPEISGCSIERLKAAKNAPGETAGPKIAYDYKSHAFLERGVRVAGRRLPPLVVAAN